MSSSSSSSNSTIKIPNYSDLIISTRLQQIESHTTTMAMVDFHWHDITVSLFYIYLLKKYSSNNICYILNRIDLLRNELSWGLKLMLRDDNKNEDEETQNYRTTCKILAAKFVDCLKRTCEFILVPVRINFSENGKTSAHENVIIYKRALNKIEHIVMMKNHKENFD